jgi:hypothetical protein
MGNRRVLGRIGDWVRLGRPGDLARMGDQRGFGYDWGLGEVGRMILANGVWLVK